MENLCSILKVVYFNKVIIIIIIKSYSSRDKNTYLLLQVSVRNLKS